MDINMKKIITFFTTTILLIAIAGCANNITKNIDPTKLPELEQYMLHKVWVLNDKFKKNFQSYNFHALYKELLNFCTVDLSSFYFDIRKDSLYCDNKETQKNILKRFCI